MVLQVIWLLTKRINVLQKLAIDNLPAFARFKRLLGKYT